MSSAQSETTELHQLSSLYRLLKRVAAKSEREVIRAFIEALAVWQDAESWAYLGDLTGRFVLDVSLPGSDRVSMPADFVGARIPPDMTTMRLSSADRDDFGFRGVADVVLCRIRGRGTSDWILVIGASADASAEARLGVYASAVAQTLTEMNGVELSQLTWAMLQHLLPASDALDGAAQGAIDALAAAVEGNVGLAVSRRDGSRLLKAGEPPDSQAFASAPNVLVLPIEMAAPFTGVIGARKDSDRPFTARDERLMQTAATTLGAWLNTAAARARTGRERRSGPHSFDQVVEQEALDARAREQALSVMVISFRPESARADVSHACVAQIRRHLRPADMAGRLSSGQIGVVLPGTSVRGAEVVAARVRHLVTSDPGLGMVAQASIGLASYVPGLSASESLLLEACARANQGRDALNAAPTARLLRQGP